MADIPRWQAIMLNKQWYDPMQLYRWTQRRQTVPHSQRKLSHVELGKITRRAASLAARRGDASAQELANAAARYPPTRGRQTTAYKRPPTYVEGRHQVFFRRRQSTLAEEGDNVGQGGWVSFKVTSAVHAYRWNPVTLAWDPLELDRHDKTILLLRPTKVEWTRRFNRLTGEGTGWQPFAYGRVTEWHRPDTRSAFRTHRSDDWPKALQAQFPNWSHLWGGLTEVDPFDPQIR